MLLWSYQVLSCNKFESCRQPEFMANYVINLPLLSNLPQQLSKEDSGGLADRPYVGCTPITFFYPTFPLFVLSFTRRSESLLIGIYVFNYCYIHKIHQNQPLLVSYKSNAENSLNQGYHCSHIEYKASTKFYLAGFRFRILINFLLYTNLP